MKKLRFLRATAFVLLLLSGLTAGAQTKTLRLIFIRHAERPEDGDNLTCQGLNRSLQLPGLIVKKFGKPDNIYVPAVESGEVTKRARMLETVTPLVVKYGLKINSAYDEKDSKSLSRALLREKGTILIVWDHKNIAPILEELGINTDTLHWSGNDYDSMWIVTFRDGEPYLTKDREGLKPAAGCSF